MATWSVWANQLWSPSAFVELAPASPPAARALRLTQGAAHRLRHLRSPETLLRLRRQKNPDFFLRISVLVRGLIVDVKRACTKQRVVFVRRSAAPSTATRVAETEDEMSASSGANVTLFFVLSLHAPFYAKLARVQSFIEIESRCIKTKHVEDNYQGKWRCSLPPLLPPRFSRKFGVTRTRELRRLRSARETFFLSWTRNIFSVLRAPSCPRYSVHQSAQFSNKSNTKLTNSAQLTHIFGVSWGKTADSTFSQCW